MKDSLNFPGDCTDIDPQHYVGPDLHGAFYRPVAAEFDGTRTRVDYLPFADAHLRQIEDRARITGLFGRLPS